MCKFYLQQEGTVMAIVTFVPNLFMSKFETEMKKKYQYISKI